ncbi:catechol 1,2-dioxygenase, partial [Streptomyces sp. SID10244]|nr:catechol 1,2-dioxygenase [Streptomyces sp. SID10244]
GANASARFRERMASAGTRSGVVDTERVNYLATKVVKGLNDIIISDRVSYEEYNALKAWLIRVGEDGEWPLFLDVWLEHSV